MLEVHLPGGQWPLTPLRRLRRSARVTRSRAGVSGPRLRVSRAGPGVGRRGEGRGGPQACYDPLMVSGFVALATSILLLSAAAGAPAQNAAATLLVEARDASGAPLPGVVVTAVNEQTKAEHETVTEDDGTGDLRIPGGLYTLRGVLSGFKTAVI